MSQTNFFPSVLSNDGGSDTTQNEKKGMIQIFKQCLDIMRRDGIIGFKALHNFCYCVVLKSIESHFGKEIDIDNFNYNNINGISEFDFEERKRGLLHLARFSNLVKVPNENLIGVTGALWDEVLSQHPTLSKFFQKGKWFDIQKPHANHKGNFLKCAKLLKLLFDKINEIKPAKADILGDAYEKIMSDQINGHTLGQFFTPPDFKEYVIEKINPQIFPNGSFESCCDPAMGTAGFLTTFINHIIKQSSERKIPIDWAKSKKLIYGKEIESDTYQLAFANLMLGTGHIFDHLDYGDSIHESILQQFDIVTANPPFGIKGLKYDLIDCAQKERYIPIRTNNIVWLFIQAVICMLKIGGRAGVIVPCGQELFGRAFTDVRKYLLKTCDLTQITILPSGFAYTAAKTYVLFFTKKKNGADIMQRRECTKLRNPKLFYDYNFNNDDHETKSIKFYEFDKKEKSGDRFIAEIPIDQIINKEFKLDFSSYNQQEKKTYGSGVVIKRLGDISTILPKSKRRTSEGNEIGLYPFFTSSFTVKYADFYDYNQEAIIIGLGGRANINYATQFSCSDHNLVIAINKPIEAGYVYLYLLNNMQTLQNAFKGVGLQHISISDIKDIEIPIPTLKIQREFVVCHNKQTRKTEELKKQVIQNKEKMKKNLAALLETH